MTGHILQSLVWPEDFPALDQSLFLRGTDQTVTRGITLAAEESVQFDSYMNLFPLAKWVSQTELRDLRLRLVGTGDAYVTIWVQLAGHPAEVVVTEDITLSTDGYVMHAPLPRALPEGTVLWLQCTAKSAVQLEHALWESDQPPRRDIRMALCITTFGREEAALSTAARFVHWAEAQARAGGHPPHLLLVDNGQSLTLPEALRNSPHMVLLPNPNLGGAGGFARAMLEARRRDFTHCLFMDDDAHAPMEAIARTMAFLARARSARTAIAGAMIAEDAPHMIWENGATFDRHSEPLCHGTDLRRASAVLKMETSDPDPTEPKLYGGWWFFAFPLAPATHMPFPFFVRGDDISFSLANEFRQIMLPGVVAVQESFFAKDSPLTLYLDLRNHLAQHLILPHMEIGRRALARIALAHMLRCLITAHYETLEGLTLALEDVLAGPEHFAEQGDLAERRAALAELRQREQWQPCRPEDLPPDRLRFNPENRLLRTLMMACGNGLLVPFWHRIGHHRRLAHNQRSRLRLHWGAAKITYVDEARGLSYTTAHNKAQALRASLPFLKGVLRLMRDYSSLKARWQTGYPRFTTTRFWEGKTGSSAQQTEEHTTPTLAKDPGAACTPGLGISG